MKLAFSSNAFKKVSLEEAIEVIAGIGYRGVEVMADVPHAYPPAMPPERVEKVRKLLESKQMIVSNVNAFTLFAIGDTYHPTWIEDDAELVKKRVLHTKNAIHMTAALGGRTISLQPGGPQGTLSRE